MHGDLETLTLPCNSSYRSSDGSRQYFVNSENVVRWVDFIHSTYSKIEEIVERNMIYGGRVTVRPLSVRDAIALVEAISVLNRLLHAKALMTTIFSMNGLKKYIVEKFESARSKGMPPMSPPPNVVSYLLSSCLVQWYRFFCERRYLANLICL